MLVYFNYPHKCTVLFLGASCFYYTNQMKLVIKINTTQFFQRCFRVITGSDILVNHLNSNPTITKKKDGEIKRGSKSWESEVGSQKSGVGSRKSEVGSRESEVGSWELEVGSWKSEVRSQKLEVGSQKSEVGSRESEDGSWELEVGSLQHPETCIPVDLDFP